MLGVLQFNILYRYCVPANIRFRIVSVPYPFHYGKPTIRRRPEAVGVGAFAVGVGLGRRRPSAYLRRRSSPSAYTNNRRRIRNRRRSRCGTHKNGSRPSPSAPPIRRRQRRRPSAPRGASWCVWDVAYADGKAVGVFVTIWSILDDVAAPCAPGKCSTPTAMPSAYP